MSSNYWEEGLDNNPSSLPCAPSVNRNGSLVKYNFSYVRTSAIHVDVLPPWQTFTLVPRYASFNIRMTSPRCSRTLVPKTQVLKKPRIEIELDLRNNVTLRDNDVERVFKTGYLESLYIFEVYFLVRGPSVEYSSPSKNMVILLGGETLIVFCRINFVV